MEKMESRFLLELSSKSAERAEDLVGLLGNLVVRRAPDDVSLHGLPAWLSTAFAPASTDSEASEWVALWRAATPAEKGALEVNHGWEFGEWIHWFSTQNELWEIRSAELTESGGVEVLVEHVDDPFPVQALEWLVDVAGYRVASVIVSRESGPLNVD
ncbi:hypothetical protein I6A84_31130 [Frankia sp. CNm7]|uniref:Uncharacterized protein n=1 Tax=Frankia nepalensis TaxID=1836974 RepID=A0A937RF04_9ACTN|nr:hypothetical protein [Frankia nepalensis]MBL7500248.1 hypothetical protein [Frankia nepalensis]MBL7513524.1 hypothetical protein [Frankia nepalensis]MBL7522419.1 hypothetical protein [Frankia nepalensis]MBL7628987.1 hypothetical protein [Frankia nepalensis]